MPDQPEPTIDELLRAESGMDNSFAACAAALFGRFGWLVVMASMGGMAYGWPSYVDLALLLFLLGSYLWFAASVARGAAKLGKSGPLYLAWVLGAPVLASLVGVPVLSAGICASPLSLKWLLGSELRATIVARTLSD